MSISRLPFCTPARRANAVIITAVIAAVGLWCGAAGAQPDKNAERLVRRAQLQVQSLQQQLEAAQAAKTQAETAKADVEKRQTAGTAALAQARVTLRRSEEARRALEVERSALTVQLAAATTQIGSTQRAGEAALAAKDREHTATIQARESAQAQLQVRLDQQVALVGECTNKNERLVALGAELLERYRNKGFAAVLSQKEPVLAFGDVQMFNLVQDYRDRTDAERFRAPQAR